MPVYYSDRSFMGGAQIIKTAGQAGGISNTTPLSIPVLVADPQNDTNYSYPEVVNASQGQINAVQGKKMPEITLQTAAMPSWFTAANINDLIGGNLTSLDANYMSSEFAINLFEPILGNRTYTHARCKAIEMIFNAKEGPILCNLRFECLYGDSEDGSAPSFGTTGTGPFVGTYTPAAGLCYGTKDVDMGTLNGVAGSVDNWAVNVVREQIQQVYANKSIYGDIVTSGPIGGTLSVQQTRTASTLPANPFVIKIGTTGTGVQLSFSLNLDRPKTPFNRQTGKTVRQYTMVDLTGTAYANAFPLQITSF